MTSPDPLAEARAIARLICDVDAEGELPNIAIRPDALRLLARALLDAVEPGGSADAHRLDRSSPLADVVSLAKGRIAMDARQWGFDFTYEESIALCFALLDAVEWKDIADAPQDGTLVLLFAKASFAEARVRIVGFWLDDPGNSRWVGIAFSTQPLVTLEPTHWLPLPAAPEGS